MGQVLSYIWRCLCPKHQGETQTTQQDDQLQQPSHCITIPNNAVARHVSGSNPVNVAPQAPSFVVNLNNLEQRVTRTKKGKEKEVKVLEEKDDVHALSLPQWDPYTRGKRPLQNVTNEIVRSTVCHESKEATHALTLPQWVPYTHEKTPLQHVTKEIVPTVCHGSKEATIKRIGPYTSMQKILLVGEGDFSFSACLACAFGTATNIIATSLNSQEFLIRNYGKFLTNKMTLENKGGMVIHGINANTMAKDLAFRNMKFDRIIYNFPHTGNFGGTDSHLRKNKDLVSGFLRNAKTMIKEDGEIHITHKSSRFFRKWDIPKIGYDNGLRLIQEVDFNRNVYPGYHTKYGFGGDKDFNCNPSRTYMFGLIP